MDELQALIAALVEAFAKRRRSEAGRSTAGRSTPDAGSTVQAQRPAGALPARSGLGLASRAEPGRGTPMGLAGRAESGRPTPMRPEQGLVAALRSAFSERIAQPEPTSPPAPLVRAPEPPRSETPSSELPFRRPPSATASAEAGLVTGLFARPQSLVAAFIVAEVLAKPVALRDRDTARGTTAL